MFLFICNIYIYVLCIILEILFYSILLKIKTLTMKMQSAHLNFLTYINADYNIKLHSNIFLNGKKVVI